MTLFLYIYIYTYSLPDLQKKASFYTYPSPPPSSSIYLHTLHKNSPFIYSFIFSKYENHWIVYIYTYTSQEGVIITHTHTHTHTDTTYMFDLNKIRKKKELLFTLSLKKRKELNRYVRYKCKKRIYRKWKMYMNEK